MAISIPTRCSPTFGRAQQLLRACCIDYTNNGIDFCLSRRVYPTLSTVPLFTVDTPSSPQIKASHPECPHLEDYCKQSSGESAMKFKVPLSEYLSKLVRFIDSGSATPSIIQGRYEESSVYLYGIDEKTNRISEPRHSPEQAILRQVSTYLDNELSVESESRINSDEFHEPFATPPGLLSQIQANVARYLAGRIQENYEYQVNSTISLDDSDSGTISGSDIESIFDFVPDPETDANTDALSSYSDHVDLDPSFVPGADYYVDASPRNAQAIELDHAYDQRQDSSTDDELKVLPSEDLPQNTYQLRHLIDQVSSLQDSMSLDTELGLIRNPLESNVVSTDDLNNAVAEIARQVQEELQRCLASASSNYGESQISLLTSTTLALSQGAISRASSIAYLTLPFSIHFQVSALHETNTRLKRPSKVGFTPLKRTSFCRRICSIATRMKTPHVFSRRLRSCSNFQAEVLALASQTFCIRVTAPPSFHRFATSQLWTNLLVYRSGSS
ncbi:hypothetical protein C8R44DRAFT_862298 [Mycena epipterygia]|nr:hypothetical protein C8R44DRAFT_862298 [Mycena epipterygia]